MRLSDSLVIATAALVLGLTCLQAQANGGWFDLLPGGDASQHWVTTGNWITEADGVLHLSPREGERGWKRYSAYLWSKDTYTDFEIEFDYKVERRGNSGFYFHVGDTNSPVAKGIEVQIYDSHGRQQMNDHTSGGVIPGIAPTANAARPAGEWNRFSITCRGENLTVKLNGEVVNEVELGTGRLKNRPDSGHIGFQDHGLPLWLRNIRFRTL
jgi:hypothetical protein